MKRKDYRRPLMLVAGMRQRHLLMASATQDATSSGILGGFINYDCDAWNSSSSSDGSSIGGWTDSGGDAWE